MVLHRDMKSSGYGLFNREQYVVMWRRKTENHYGARGRLNCSFAR